MQNKAQQQKKTLNTNSYNSNTNQNLRQHMLQIMLKYTHPIKIVIVDKLFPSGKVVSAGRTEKAKTGGTENLSAPKRLPYSFPLSLWHSTMDAYGNSGPDGARQTVLNKVKPGKIVYLQHNFTLPFLPVSADFICAIFLPQTYSLLRNL